MLNVVCMQEIITDMKEMVKGMMKAFYRTNHGVKPERILFYRDGVSEGQFQTVSVVFCDVHNNNNIYLVCVLLYIHTCTRGSCNVIQGCGIHSYLCMCTIFSALHVDHPPLTQVSR